MQKNLLENAEKKHFSEEQMAVLSDEAFTIAELRRAFRYFDCQRQYYTDDETADEFKRCVQILRPALAVWSYADRITKDQTAICSFLDKSGRFSDGKEDTRYTLEFGLDKKGRYFIRQIQGKYNQGNTSELYEHVKNLLV